MFRSAHKKLKSNALGYKMLMPASLLILLVSIYPLLNGFSLAFQDYNLLRPKRREFVLFANFVEILTKDRDFYRVLIFSFIYAFCVVLVSYVFGLCLALLMNREIKFRGVIRAIILIPWVIPPVVAATNWLWLLNDQLGFINRTLQSIGLISKPILFLADPFLAKITVIMTGAWKSFPFMMITLLAGLQSIPHELYESAYMDGASFAKSLRYITLPMLKPISLISTTLMFIWTFNNFENIYLLTYGGPMESTYVLPIYSYYTAFVRSEIGYASAISTILLVVLLGLALVYMRVLRTQENY